jgi:hypothetical protein
MEIARELLPPGMKLIVVDRAACQRQLTAPLQGERGVALGCADTLGPALK